MNTTLSSALLSKSGAVTAASALVIGAMAGSGSASATPSTATNLSAPAVGSVTVKDSRSDMLGHGADIFSVRLVNRDRVRVVVQHRDLVRSWKPQSSGTIYLDTDRSTTGPDYALVAGLYAGTDYTLHPTDGWKIRYRKSARGWYAMKLDYVHDRTVLDVARTTLGSPDDVRVSVHTAGDDQDGHIIHDWLKRPNSFTPWVARG